jgi:hypothetical protein
VFLLYKLYFYSKFINLILYEYLKKILCIINKLIIEHIKLTKITRTPSLKKKTQLNDAKIDLVEGQTFCKGMSGDFTRMTCSVPNAYQPMTMRVHLYQP